MARHTGPERPDSEPPGESPEERRRAGRDGGERESIWSIPADLKGLYFSLFSAQVIIAAVWLTLTAISDASLVGVRAKVFFVWQNMAPAAITSAAFALILTDAWKTIMVIGSSLEEWINRRRERQIKAAVDAAVGPAVEAAVDAALKAAAEKAEADKAQARADGFEDASQKWRGWYQRRQAAQDAGADFNEPPPGDAPAGDETPES